MIGVLVVAVLAVVALAYVSRPLLSGPEVTPDEDRELAFQEIAARKRAALGAILDVEEERAIGKLSAEDLVVLRAQYESQALSALRELDVLTADSEGRSDELEAEISRMRAEMTCPNCGALRTGATCSQCGSQ